MGDRSDHAGVQRVKGRKSCCFFFHLAMSDNPPNYLPLSCLSKSESCASNGERSLFIENMKLLSQRFPFHCDQYCSVLGSFVFFINENMRASETDPPIQHKIHQNGCQSSGCFLKKSHNITKKVTKHVLFQTCF